jgi:hypothetical protein
MSFTVLALLVLLVVGVTLGIPATITWLKGQRLLFLAGFVFGGLVWYITALRLARPDSWWARRFYDATKLERAQKRYS